MKINILGSGTMLSDKKRNPSGYLIEQAGDYAMLDFGPGILRQLKSMSVELLSIETIFISHFHLDHCADVFPFLMNRYLIDETANKNLKIYGPPGLIKWYDTIASTQGAWLTNYPAILYEITEKQLIWAGMTVSTQRTFHTQNSIAYRFCAEKRFFYSSDTDYNPELIDFAKNSHLALIECSLPDEQKREGHLTPTEVGQLAALAKVDHLVLTHLYPENDTPDLKSKVAKYFSRKITVAEDFMEFNL